MTKTNKGILSMTIGEIGDAVLDSLIGLVVKAEKTEQVERLTFEGLRSRAVLLAENYEDARRCKCVICRDSARGVYAIGIWAVDSSGQIVQDEYGMAQKVLDAKKLDDKLLGMLNGHVCANFILELN